MHVTSLGGLDYSLTRVLLGRVLNREYVDSIQFCVQYVQRVVSLRYTSKDLRKMYFKVVYLYFGVFYFLHSDDHILIIISDNNLLYIHTCKMSSFVFFT